VFGSLLVAASNSLAGKVQEVQKINLSYLGYITIILLYDRSWTLGSLIFCYSLSMWLNWYLSRTFPDKDKLGGLTLCCLGLNFNLSGGIHKII
jgi:hypothetical protein